VAEAKTGAAVVVHGRHGNKVRGGESRPLVRNPFAVAVAASASAVVAFVASASGPQAVVAAFMAAVLVVLAASDLERRIIPNRIVLPATAIVLVANIAISPARAPVFILAALSVGIAFLIPNLINASLIGMGDVKLMMLLGVGLGWGAVGAIMVAFLAMFPFALATLIRGGVAARKTALPFGPFLALGGLVILIVPHLAGLG
jgi:leader peptidase (prepilin peptidase) / N-methyltransferase